VFGKECDRVRFGKVVYVELFELLTIRDPLDEFFDTDLGMQLKDFEVATE